MTFYRMAADADVYFTVAAESEEEAAEKSRLLLKKWWGGLSVDAAGAEDVVVYLSDAAGSLSVSGSKEAESKPLARSCVPGDLVTWKQLSGRTFVGRLLEWDSNVAVVRTEQGTKSVEC